MTDETVPEFGQALPDAAERSGSAEGPRTTTCPTCGARFSPDARFCPFDGSALIAAAGWHPSADELLGTVVDGRYELLRVIGEGGMGTVYEVRHRALGKRFALKALRKDLAQDAEIAARFIQEARTAAAVSHPGLVEITDFGRLESGQVYFVMELLEGQSLAALLRSGPLPAARGLAIVRQLALAVKAAHDAAIVHRDLKPDNVHVGRGDNDADRVKVVDFGLAKVIGASSLTRAGMVFGTPHYMSPEQASGEAVDHRADIYALGIVMYEMFTGRVPFEADSYMGVLTKHLYMPPAPPSSLRPELKTLGALEDIILRCLQKRPDARYDDLASLLADWDEKLPRGASLEGARPEPPLPDSRELRAEHATPRRRGLGAAPWVGIVLAFLLGAALVAGARSRAASPRKDSSAAPSLARSSVEAPSRAAPPASHDARPISDPEPTPSVVSSAPARKPAAAVRTAGPSKTGSVPVTPKRPPSTNRGLGQGEIVDPWAR